MKKLFVFAAALVCAAVSASAQTAAPAPKVIKVGVVDMQRVSQESLLGKSYATKMDQMESEIRSELTKRQNQVAQIDAAIKTLQDDLAKQSSILSPDAIEKKQQEVVKKNRERQALAEDSQADIQRMQQAAQQKAQEYQVEFNQKIQPILQAVGKDKGLDMILDRATVVLINNDLDVTRDVIVKADDAEKAARPAAAPAAPKPAAPAAAPAAPAAKPSPTPQQ